MAWPSRCQVAVNKAGAACHVTIFGGSQATFELGRTACCWAVDQAPGYCSPPWWCRCGVAALEQAPRGQTHLHAFAGHGAAPAPCCVSTRLRQLEAGREDKGSARQICLQAEIAGSGELSTFLASSVEDGRRGGVRTRPVRTHPTSRGQATARRQLPAPPPAEG